MCVFTPLVFTTTGSMGREAPTFYKRLANMLSPNQQKPTPKQQIDHAGQINRQETLAPHTRMRQQNKRIPLVVSYHPSPPHLAALTSESHPVFHASHQLQQAIPEPPIVAFHRPKNLRNLLVSAELRSADNEPNQTKGAVHVVANAALHADTSGLERRSKAPPLVTSSTYKLHQHARQATSSM